MRVLSEHSDFDQITVPLDGEEVVLVRVGPAVHAYRNRCPHLGVGLDWGDGRCLADTGELVCAMHGARFQADTGACTDGPCRGDSLTRLPVRVDADGRVVLDA